MHVIFLRFSCNIHNVVRKHGGWGDLPLYFVCVVSCIILWPTAGLTLYFLIPAEWNMVHTQKDMQKIQSQFCLESKSSEQNSKA